MKISILTLFPQMFSGPFEYSIVKRAINKRLVNIEFVDIRKFGLGRHQVIDDKVYGGGIGMVMKVDVLDKAIEKTKLNKGKEKVVLLSASGKSFKQKKALEYSKV